MIPRLLNPSKSQSYFIFGARGTGKSTLIQSSLDTPSTWSIDLLDPESEDLFSRQPKQLETLWSAKNPKPSVIFIDEVQRVPKLLNLVHRMIERDKLRFILTGSSARKLKRGAANLLAGRAFVYKLFPFTAHELGSRFNLQEALSWGTLPKLFSLVSDEDRATYLRSYALTYLKEEVQAEQLVRRLDPFRYFLEIAAQSNGKILNYNRIGRDVDVDNKTVQSYFQILEDTWLGFLLPAYHRSVRKSQRAHPKFYFFDPGVKRALERTLQGPLQLRTSTYGEAFEHWVILEFFRMNEYLNADYRLSYLETREGVEIDLILHRPNSATVLVEIKSTDRIDEIEVNRLRRAAESFRGARVFYLSNDPNPHLIDSVHCLPWQQGLREVFSLGG